jgi:hypothetical protein
MRFALVLNQRIEMRLVVPLALSVLLSGAGLIWSADIDFFHSPFLIVALALYLVAVGIALGGLVPATERLVHLTENMPISIASRGAANRSYEPHRTLSTFGCTSRCAVSRDHLPDDRAAGGLAFRS